MSPLAHVVQQVVPFASRWTELHPELKDRIEKAVFLVPQVSRTPEPNVYRVRGDTGSYRVRVWPDQHRSTCTCPDSRAGNHCKHRLAVALKVVAGLDRE